jgi:hypothetical protein
MGLRSAFAQLKYKKCVKKFDGSQDLFKRRLTRSTKIFQTRRQSYDRKPKAHIHVYAVELAACFLFIVPWRRCRDWHGSYRFLARCYSG